VVHMLLLPFLFLMGCALYTPWSPPMVTHCGQISSGVITGEQRDCFELSAVAVTPVLLRELGLID